MRVLQLVLVACVVGCVHAANFLAFYTVPGRSHWQMGQIFLRELASRGHQVTVVTPFKSEGPIENWHEVIIPNVKKLFGDGASFNMLTTMNNPFLGVFFLSNFAIKSCDMLLADEKIQQLYKSNQKFDAVIIEDFYQECYEVFAYKFNAPLIQILPHEGHQWSGDKMGNPAEISYVPDVILCLDDHMNFVERLYNAVFSTVGRLVLQLYLVPGVDSAIQRHLKDPTIPSVASIEKQTALMLINSHVSISSPRTLVPNMVHVAGFHIKPPKKLPEDLQKYLDNSKQGVIYFSLGSNIQSSEMPEEKRIAFATAFSKLKQNVIWKWESDSLPNKPNNVMIGKWLPQSDILAHKNVKLFITHGGLFSTMEAIERGVPLVAIPFFGDQKLNAKRAVRDGYALRLDFPNVTAESLQWAMSEMLDNPRYSEKVKHLSSIFRDRPKHPMEEAIYWTEYVVRHNGAPHLRSAALDLTWYQYLLLDVIAAVLIAVIVLLSVAFLLLRTVLRLIFGKSTKKHSVGKKKSTKRD